MFNISRCVCKFLFCPVISIMCVKKCTSLLRQNILFDWLNIIYNKAVLYASFINCTIHKMYIYVYVQMYIYRAGFCFTSIFELKLHCNISVYMFWWQIQWLKKYDTNSKSFFKTICKCSQGLLLWETYLNQLHHM